MAVRAGNFHFLTQALFVAGVLFLAIRPFRPLGYPVAYSVLVVGALVTLENIDLEVLAVVYAAVTAAIFGILERARFERGSGKNTQQWFLFGYAAAYALGEGAVFFAYPGTFSIAAQAITMVLAGALVYECIMHGKGIGGPYMGARWFPFAVAGVYGLILSEFSWALALLPIGYMNSAGILGAVLFFSTDLFFSFMNKTLNSRMLVVSVGLFVSIAAIILGLSRWTI